jgi:hypothetical protein
MTERDDMQEDSVSRHSASRDPLSHDSLAGDRALERTGRLLRSAMPAANFSAGFADRTLTALTARRVAVSPAALRVSAMQRSFRFLAAAAVIAIVALGVHNTLVARVDDTTLVEAAIGLQPVSAASVLAYSSEALQ